MHKYLPVTAYIVVGLLFMAYLTLRAVLLPVTIDEAGTYYNFALKSIWDIVIYSGDPSPNNHILNTLLIKLFTSIFGLSSFTLRLPNLLAFVLFYVIIVKWLSILRKAFWFVTFGIIVILANPYLLDFFSLARGYGISIALLIASLFYTYRFFKVNEQQYALYAMLIAGAAVYANFTLINYYICLFGFIIIIASVRGWQQSLKQFVKHVYLLFIVTLLLALICYLPISRMIATNQFVYWETDGFFKSTLVPLVDASRYGQDYFGLVSVQALALVSVVIYGLMCIYFVVAKLMHQKKILDLFSFWLFIFFTGIIALINLQYVLLDIPFLNARGALFLFPMFVLIGIFIINELLDNVKQIRPVFILPVIVLACIHLGCTLNIHSFREWWYDAYTKDVLEIVKADSDNKQTSLNTAWIFNNSFRLHIETEGYNEIKLASFHNELWPDSNYVYYYCERNDLPKLQNNYTAIKEFDYGNFILLKRITQD